MVPTRQHKGKWRRRRSGEERRRRRSVTLRSPPLVDDDGGATQVSVSLQWCQRCFITLLCSSSRQHLSELSGAEPNSDELTKVWSHRLTCTLAGTNRAVRIIRISELTGVELTSFYCIDNPKYRIWLFETCLTSQICFQRL